MLMYGQDVVGSGVNPGQLSGLQTWYDASNAAYLTLSATAITQMLDRSGNGNHTAVQGTGTARPTWTANQQNGLPAAVFDGGDTLVLPAGLLTIPTGNNTIFTVSKRTTADAFIRRIITIGASGSTRTEVGYTATANTVDYQSRNASGSMVAATGFTETNSIITSAYRSGTTQSISVNGGAATTNANGADATGITEGAIGANSLGNSLFLIGAVSEILIYNRALTTAEIAQVESYLNSKWRTF